MPAVSADHLGELLDRSAALDRHTQHFAEHRDTDLESDAGRNPEHRLREEVGEKPSR
jgi:hypothetical protein